ncbi:MAG TPA: type II toxin-antitoxin system ParD family antitoxin [Asticcacaulis sp.]|nr:type II toxin-antitoxin system ParD family antitoxin [Asticcacaulis sp.]
MTKPVSVSLDDQAAAFLEGEVKAGRFASQSDVVRAGLRLLETQEARISALRAALDDGEASGYTDEFDFDDFLAGRRIDYAKMIKAREA